MAKGYDWATIKAEYETGKYSMRELSDKHGFNENYAARKALKENWEKGKSKEKVKKESAKRVIERLGKQESDIKFDLFKTVMMIESKMQGEWNNKENPNFDILKASKISTEILQNIMDMKYELLDIQKVAKRIEQNIDNKISIEDQTEYIEKYLKNG